ncbi:FMN-dependent dehydrogenase [Ophiocordyceps sinensis CO18]|uniref:FMN-dependent dehydrogenase n=1 Tax=Ophiocordyceps sinensis (strain Co18 / CGMCC 3.14243) TaxID=911162 RepID=T5A180_OPHSC|nr:FMN-dependent dehydrogenase [Ophiocordyceps sinensis CO18]
MALKGDDIAKHNDAKSCWVIIHGKAYDVTEFLPEHPGGPKIILQYAGKDATDEFDPIHPPDTLDKYLHRSKHLGAVDIDTKPLLSQCYNLFDFEAVARRVMKKTAWAYYSSAADDEITMRENHAALHRIWFRPQVLVDVETIDFSTTMLGAKCAAPFYVTATALGKLGHPEGEVLLKDEMEMNMRLIGCPSVRDLHPGLVDTRSLFVHSNPTPVDALSATVYDPLVVPPQRPKGKL